MEASTSRRRRHATTASRQRCWPSTHGQHDTTAHVGQQRRPRGWAGKWCSPRVGQLACSLALMRLRGWPGFGWPGIRPKRSSPGSGGCLAFQLRVSRERREAPSGSGPRTPASSEPAARDVVQARARRTVSHGGISGRPLTSPRSTLLPSAPPPAEREVPPRNALRDLGVRVSRQVRPPCPARGPACSKGLLGISPNGHRAGDVTETMTAPLGRCAEHEAIESRAPMGGRSTDLALGPGLSRQGRGLLWAVAAARRVQGHASMGGEPARPAPGRRRTADAPRPCLCATASWLCLLAHDSYQSLRAHLGFSAAVRSGGEVRAPVELHVSLACRPAHGYPSRVPRG